MDARTEIIPCRGNECNKKLRVPAGHGRLIVTCPNCKTTWEWSSDSPVETAKMSRQRVPLLVTVLAVVLILACGAWNRAWIPTLLFLFTILVWWCARKATTYQEARIWQKGVNAVWEATASIAGAAAIGFASVIILVTFLNSYVRVTPSHYPSWLPTLQNGLIGISTWFKDDNNKGLIAVIYITLIAFCIVVAGLARRHKKEWRPIGTLSKWKQRLTQAVVALQAFTFFTFFSQAPVNEHLLKLAQQLRWRYGVAFRAERELETKRLLAEQIKEAAKRQEGHTEEDRNEFVVQIAKLRSGFKPIDSSSTTEGLNDSSPSNGPDGSPPYAPPGWRPPSWPQPPDYILDKIEKGEPFTSNDYRPSREPRSASASTASNDPTLRKNVQVEREGSWEVQARAIIITQIEDAEPTDGNRSPIDEHALSEPTKGMVWPIETTEHREKARGQIAEQEANADKAERLYGQAVKGALEAMCEYLGLQVTADPVVEAWIDLTVDNLADRIYGYIFPRNPGKVSSLASHLRRLFSPKETRTERIAENIRARIQALDYDGAERLIVDLGRRYPTTKAANLAGSLAEECSFKRAEFSYKDQSMLWEKTVQNCSDYLRDYSSSPRSSQVREWLKESIRQKALADADARIPRMIIYVRRTCGNSQYFKKFTIQDSLVRAEMDKFLHEFRDIDNPSIPMAERAKIESTGEQALPIVVFENKAGDVLNSIGGRRALDPTALLSKMRSVY